MASPTAKPGQFLCRNKAETFGLCRWTASAYGTVEMVTDHRDEDKDRQYVVDEIEHRYSFDTGESTVDSSSFSRAASSSADRATIPKDHRVSLRK
jgi:hypothetical protein